MKSIRRIHGWLGILFAPSLLLFALSGVLQMFGCHEGQGSSAPAGWIVRLAQIHMKQTVEVPRGRGPKPAPAQPAPGASASPGAGAGAAERPAEAPAEARAEGPAEGPRPARSQPTTMPLKIFFTLMSFGLFASTLLGLYIAFNSKRDRGLHVGLLIAGLVIPIVLLVI
jgi:hypothetical protein